MAMIPTNSETTRYKYLTSSSASSVVYSANDIPSTNIAEDDHFVVFIYKDDDAGGAQTAPSGWTKWFEYINADGDDGTLVGYYHTVTASEASGGSAAATFTLGETESYASIMFHVDGADDDDFTDSVTPATTNTQNTDSPTPAAVTTNTDGAVVIVISGNTHDAGHLNQSSDRTGYFQPIGPSGYTVEDGGYTSGTNAEGAPGRLESGASFGHSQMSWGWKTVATAGTETPGNWSQSGGNGSEFTNLRDHKDVTCVIKPLSNDINLAGTTAGIAATTGKLYTPDGRSARTSAQVATQTASDARSARTSVQVAVETNYYDSAVELAGTPAGVGAVTGTLHQDHHATSTSGGVASVTGTLTNHKLVEVAGTSDGASTATGSLSLVTNLFGESDGVAASTGTLSLTYRLFGTSDGVASTTGTLTNQSPISQLAGTPDGTSTVSGSLSQDHSLAATTDGVATVTGELEAFTQGELTGTSNGSATVTSTVAVPYARTTRTSIQVATVLDGGDMRTTRTSVQVAWRLDPTIEGGSDGTSTTSAVLFAGVFLEGQSDGVATARGITTKDRPLDGEIDGVATVTGTLDPHFSSKIPGPIPYPFPHLSPFIHELNGLVLGDSTVTGVTVMTNESTTSSAGGSSVTGTLTQIVPVDPPGPDALAGVSAGGSTVTGQLDGSYLFAECAGQSDGVATVTHVLASDSINQIRTLYVDNNVGPGHSPTDDKSGRSDFVSQTFPDGSIDVDVRDLYLINNVGISHNPTDDKSGIDGFVSQLFPDLEWDEVSRWLYLPQYVFALPDEPSRLTIGPTPKLPASMLRGKPPVSRVGRGPEVV